MLGAHVSVAGGVENAPENGSRLGCQAIQIFTRSQRRWQSPPLSAISAQSFRDLRKARGIRSAVAHASYLFNLAGDGQVLRRSRQGLLDEWDRSERLGLDGIVLHPGSHLGAGESRGLDRIIHSLNHVETRRSSHRSKILLEATAGQGSNLGYRFEHLQVLLGGVKHPERFGVCLDTAHIFAAGYDIRTAAGLRKVLKEFDRLVGLERLEAIHLNDSKAPFASRRDRHENIGKGKIGLEPFRVLVNHRRLQKIPMILETPGGDPGYRRDLATLRRLLKR